MSKRKRNRKHQDDVAFLNEQLLKNGRAMDEGPAKKRWSKHDIRTITPLTNNQHSMFQQYYQGDHICAYGTAGSGKSFIALFLAITDVLNPQLPQQRVIIVRSAVPTRDMGFMPGTLEEKIALYETPYREIITELFGRGATYNDMKEAGIVEFMTTSYVRGLTWDNAIVVVDEGQNLTTHEVNSIMTRIGADTRVIFTGDLNQSDLHGKTNGQGGGMERFLKIIDHMPEFSKICFTTDDIVRSKFVKSWIVASEKVK